MTLKYNPFTNKLDLVGSGGSGGGDVSGPGSSTDNAIVRWSGATGTLIQNSVATLSDTGDIVANSIDLTVPVAVADGGTNISSYTTGDLLYASGSTTLSKLAIGSDTQVLTVSGGVPTWAAAAGGGVTSVSGTANRITSTGGATPVIDISASYVGQTSITTLGTITTGVWNGTTIAVANGGTGATTLTGILTGNGTSAFTASTVTQYGVLIGGASNAVASLGAGTAGQVLQSSGAGVNPAYSTATYPSTATGTGTILRADGTNWAASTATYPNTATTGDIIYGSASNIYSNLPISTYPGAPLAVLDTGLPGYLSPVNYVYIYDDFLSSNSAAAYSWNSATANSGSVGGSSTSAVGHPGVVQLRTNSSTNAQAIFRLNNISDFVGGGYYTQTFYAKLSSLSDATDTYTASIGLSTGAVAGAWTDGMFFQYTHGTNSGKWTINTTASSSTTTANTNDTADTNWHKFTIVADSALTSIAFYIDGTQVSNSPITTNIPASSSGIGPMVHMIKSAGSGDRRLITDYFTGLLVLTNAR